MEVIRRALADPERLSAGAAACAAALAAALGARVVAAHGLELAVMVALAYAAWALLGKHRALSGAEQRPAEAAEAAVMQASEEATKAMFRTMFAAAAPPADGALPAEVAEEVVLEATEASDAAAFFRGTFAAAPAAAANPGDAEGLPRIAVVPLHAVSAYDDAYAAAVHCAVFSPRGVALCVAARGDGSLGAVQAAEHSTLCAAPADGGDERRAAPQSVTWHTANDDNAVRCVLHYATDAVARGDALSFKFGDPFGGYQAAELCVLDDAFVQEHGLHTLLA